MGSQFHQFKHLHTYLFSNLPKMSIHLDNGTGSNPAAEKKALIENACTTAEEFCKNFFDRIDNKRHTIEKLYLPTATLSWNGNKVEGASTIQKFLLDKIPNLTTAYYPWMPSLLLLL